MLHTGVDEEDRVESLQEPIKASGPRAAGAAEVGRDAQVLKR